MSAQEGGNTFALGDLGAEQGGRMIVMCGHKLLLPALSPPQRSRQA